MIKEEIKEEVERIVYGMGYDTFEADGHSDSAVEDILAKTLEAKEKRIEELEEENAELKEKSKRQSNNYKHDVDMLIEDNKHKNKVCKKLAHQVNVIQDNFTKAKELLSRLKSDFKNFAFEVGVEAISETYFEVEKFLKEVE